MFFFFYSRRTGWTPALKVRKTKEGLDDLDDFFKFPTRERKKEDVVVVAGDRDNYDVDMIDVPNEDNEVEDFEFKIVSKERQKKRKERQPKDKDGDVDDDEAEKDWEKYDPFRERDDDDASRRSRRKRVLPIMHWLGEKPMYERKQRDNIPVVKAYGFEGRKGPPSPTPKRGRKPTKRK